jgi:hypothetical protein
MTQQTAVEWLEEELADNLKVIILNNDYTLMEKLFAKAKEMEKEQLIETCKHGNLPTFLGRVLTAEQYYNETYNK